MSFLSDNFAVNSGQITTFGSAGANTGSSAIGGSQLTLTVPISGGGIVSAVGAGENAWPIPSSSLFISTQLGSPTWARPAAGAPNLGVGIVLDANNQLWFELGPHASTSTLSLFVYMVVGGIAGTAGSATITNSNLPDQIGFGLVNNIVTCWLSFSGVWQQVTAIGVSGDVDVSSRYDFTPIGALAGWVPGVFWAQVNNASPQSIAVNLLQYLAPFVNPVTGAIVPNVIGETQAQAGTDIAAVNLVVGTVTPQLSPLMPGTVIGQSPPAGSAVNVGTAVNLTIAGVSTQTLYGKFVGSAVYPPVLLIDAKGLKPRVWMPKENVTVKT